jgi:hypothetical protein
LFFQLLMLPLLDQGVGKWLESRHIWPPVTP